MPCSTVKITQDWGIQVVEALLFVIHGGFRKFWKNGLNKVHISLYYQNAIYCKIAEF